MKAPVKNILTYAGGLLLIFGLIGFTMKKNADRKVAGIRVDIDDKEGIYFIDQEEVLSILYRNDSSIAFNSELVNVKLKEMEKSIEKHPFVSQAEVYHDLQGRLEVVVKQAVPIGRIYNPVNEDFYIGQDGKLLPINAKFTARVPLIELEYDMKWEHSLVEDELGLNLLDMLNDIYVDPFWKAQIAHITITDKGEVEIIPQVTKQKVIFGQLDNYTEKFEKLLLFYKEILPNKGWNTYTTVNLKFKNQIVCQ